MKINKMLVVTLFAGVLFAGQGIAEEQTQQDMQIEADTRDSLVSNTDVVWLTKSAVQLKRQFIVASAMQLSDEEGAEFWPIYAQYWAEIDGLRNDMIKLVGEFVATKGILPEERSSDMINEYLEIRQDEFAIKQKYVELFKSVLPAVKVMRYYQIENKLDAIVNYEVTQEIPLAQISEN